MATKTTEQLTTEIKAIAKELGMPDEGLILAPTVKLLEEQLKGFKAELAPALISEEDKAELDAKEAEKAKETIYTVAPGKAVTYKGGMLSEGDKVFPRYFPKGQETIDRFVTAGHFIKNG